MTAFKTLWRPASVCLMILPATACQTPPVPSSSVLAGTVAEAVAIERETVCEAVRPGEISKTAYDASPLEARLKMAQDVEAWVHVCAGD